MDKAVRQLAVSAGMRVEPQEVVISHPEGKVIISLIITVKVVCWTIESFDVRFASGECAAGVVVVIVHKRQDHAERARNLFWI